MFGIPITFKIPFKACFFLKRNVLLQLKHTNCTQYISFGVQNQLPISFDTYLTCNRIF